MTKLVWHYTIADHARMILAERTIRPSTLFLPPGEKPVVWFSARQHWEPTCNKALSGPGGQRIPLSMQETLRHGGGGWRFGMSASELIPWRELKRAANIAPATARGLERAARNVGADPDFWYGHIGPVSVYRCVIAALDEDGTWLESIDTATVQKIAAGVRFDRLLAEAVDVLQCRLDAWTRSVRSFYPISNCCVCHVLLLVLGLAGLRGYGSLIAPAGIEHRNCDAGDDLIQDLGQSKHTSIVVRSQ